ncbi:invasion associated locus B family protein [Bartonella ancashensis]|uniref:Uncharacterized protein n=1 Tax=Bartonella ancashensis TaxID=1318743 RepID=A0A0M4L6I9_9HYPH|nr:invasion associated locus B family protein [Bartonella ancashensis]ALE03283.1 hypothetical protein PU02_0469 [Bartonella ancashensis]
MFKKTLIIASMIVFTAIEAVWAQTPSRLHQFESWGVYSYKSPEGTVCYALSMPLSALPTTVRHGDNFFLVTKRSHSPVTFEPQFMAGYTLKEGSKVSVTIGGKTFDFFTQDSSAWLASSGVEKQLVAAMRAGTTMTVKATSKRGTNTTYSYSLRGVTAALNAAQECR